MIGQKKRLTTSAARRKHSVIAAVFDCCTWICRNRKKLVVYPSQTPRVLHDVAEGRKIIVALVAVYTIVYGDKPNIVVRKIGVTDMDKTTKTYTELLTIRTTRDFASAWWLLLYTQQTVLTRKSRFLIFKHYCEYFLEL